MKKAIIFTFALSLFALPMSLHANPPAKGDAVKPLSAMKSTIASPSKTPAKAEDAAKSAAKAGDEKKGDAKKTASDAKKDDAKK
jgi:hypothetical protein